ncbi:hypothetical protein B0H11DRAFT_1904997 [Mycena galericulata]|nr:hypothetical protein B0H11DRAFT_1904997 [Mycena galericulata]
MAGVSAGIDACLRARFEVSTIEKVDTAGSLYENLRNSASYAALSTTIFWSVPPLSGYVDLAACWLRGPCLKLLDQLRNDLTVTWIWGTGLLTQEESLVDDAVEALMDLQTERPLRIALSDSVAGVPVPLAVV